MSFLDQAKAAANSVAQAASQAASSAQQMASQAATAAQPHVQAAIDTASPHVQNLGSTLSSAASSAATGAQQLAGQAHAAAAQAAPGIIPAPSGATGSVDRSHDLKPGSPETEKLDKFFQDRPKASELQQQNILKGEPGDALAGKKADLMRAQIGDKLEAGLQQRPNPNELVKEGILNADEVPPSK